MAIDSLQRQTDRFESMGLTSLAVIFYLLELLCWHSRCALMLKVPGSTPYFLFRLHCRGMSPVKNPGKIPRTLFSGDPTKCPISGQIGEFVGILDGNPEVTFISLLLNRMWNNISAHLFSTLNITTEAADSDLNQ